MSDHTQKLDKHILYGGSQELYFDRRKHVYLLKGKIVPSATTILKTLNKPALIGWSAKMASDYWFDHVSPGEAMDEIQLRELHKAAKGAHRSYSEGRISIGTMVHDRLESYINHKLGKGPAPKDFVNDEMKASMEAYYGWEAKHSIEYLHAERKVLSVRNRHCGTADVVALVNGELEVIDFKTGKGVYAEAALQLASYCGCISEEMGTGSLGNTGDPVRRIIHLPANSAGKLTDWDESKIKDMLTGQGVEKDYESFLQLKHVYDWDQGTKDVWYANRKKR